MSDFKSAYLAAKLAESNKVALYLDYVDINDGYIHDAVLFSQIMYWHLPSKKATSKLRVNHEGHYWIAKHHEDWFAECRIKAPMSRKALKRIEKRNLIHYTVAGFGGKKTPLIRINWEGFEKAITAQYDTLYQLNMIHCIEPNTETTRTENTKDTLAQQAPAPSENPSTIQSHNDEMEEFPDCAGDTIFADHNSDESKQRQQSLVGQVPAAKSMCDRDWALLGGGLYYQVGNRKHHVETTRADIERMTWFVELGLVDKLAAKYRYKLTEKGYAWVHENLPDDWRENGIQAQAKRVAAKKTKATAKEQRRLQPPQPRGRKPVREQIEPIFERMSQLWGVPQTTTEHNTRISTAWEFVNANGTPDEVAAIYNHAKSEGWKSPTVRICVAHLGTIRKLTTDQAQAMDEIEDVDDLPALDPSAGIAYTVKEQTR